MRKRLRCKAKSTGRPGSKLVDTSIVSELFRDKARQERIVPYLQGTAISIITWGELRVGPLLMVNPGAEQRRLASLKESVEILPLTDATALSYAQVFAQLRHAGTRIPTNDIWIAVSAIKHDLPLDAKDAHFGRISGLRLV